MKPQIAFWGIAKLPRRQGLLITEAEKLFEKEQKGGGCPNLVFRECVSEPVQWKTLLSLTWTQAGNTIKGSSPSYDCPMYWGNLHTYKYMYM